MPFYFHWFFSLFIIYSRARRFEYLSKIVWKPRAERHRTKGVLILPVSLFHRYRLLTSSLVAIYGLRSHRSSRLYLVYVCVGFKPEAVGKLPTYVVCRTLLTLTRFSDLASRNPISPESRRFLSRLSRALLITPEMFSVSLSNFRPSPFDSKHLSKSVDHLCTLA